MTDDSDSPLSTDDWRDITPTYRESAAVGARSESAVIGHRSTFGASHSRGRSPELAQRGLGTRRTLGGPPSGRPRRSVRHRYGHVFGSHHLPIHPSHTGFFMRAIFPTAPRLAALTLAAAIGNPAFAQGGPPADTANDP